MQTLGISFLAFVSCLASGYCAAVVVPTTAAPKTTVSLPSTSSVASTTSFASTAATSPKLPVSSPSTTLKTSSTTVKLPESTTAAPDTVTELPEELTTIIEIEEPDGNSTDSVDFVNLPGYGVVDDANSTTNASIFSCYNRRYGYYADIAKKCFMFHLCYPVQEPQTGQLIFQRFSFVCSDNAVFDQQHLVCVDNETLSYPCSDSHRYFVESNNKLIESMQQNVQQSYAPQQQPPPQQQQQARQGTNHPSSVGQSSGERALAAVLAEAGESGIALESSEAPVNVTAEQSDAETAAQYALLEQLFG